MGCSAKQYTDIYDANQALLSGDRSAARQALASAELDDAFAADYGLNLNRVALPVNVADSFRCGVPTVSTAMALVVNDTFAPTARLDERLPQGVRNWSLHISMWPTAILSLSSTTCWCRMAFLFTYPVE